LIVKTRNATGVQQTWSKPPLVDGGAKITRRFAYSQRGQTALKLNTALIEFAPGFYRRFINAPVSMDFRHTLSAQSPNIAENYHLSAHDGYLFRFVIGMNNRRFAVAVDDTIFKSYLNPSEAMRLILNNRIADIIRENKKILYAELMQWAKNNLQS
jgi:hypothetical protein